MTCPIGVPGIEGKEPEIIAAAVVAQLLAVPSTSALSAASIAPSDALAVRA